MTTRTSNFSRSSSLRSIGDTALRTQPVSTPVCRCHRLDLHLQYLPPDPFEGMSPDERKRA